MPVRMLPTYGNYLPLIVVVSVMLSMGADVKTASVATFRAISFAVRRIYVIFAGELIPIGFSKIK